METQLNEKLVDLAVQLSYARGVKEAARLRAQCELGDWEWVKVEAKRLYVARQKPKIPAQRLYRV